MLRENMTDRNKGDYKSALFSIQITAQEARNSLQRNGGANTNKDHEAEQ